MPSTVIRSFDYDSKRRELHVDFQSGKRYVYYNVPFSTYETMKQAFAKGEFFNSAVRGHFPFKRVDAS
jgi:hypothetical protein